ncbi:MAG: PD40 domain-containing protein [Nitrospinae bacterium]|nr:PD40 domain-containing protein [Nitrospinota bacterium]
MNKLGRLRQQLVGGGFIRPDGLDKSVPRNTYMNKLCILLILLSIILTSCGAGKPKGGEGISYFGAAWLNNERIIYTKQVETVKFHYGWLAEVANMTSELIRIDYYICTMDLNGEDEKILKQFSVTDPKGGGNIRRIFMVEDGKEVPLNTDTPQRPSIYSCSKDLIVFVAHFSEGGAGGAGPIYTMKPDGSELKQVVEKGGHARLSPDSKLILYTAADPKAVEAYEKYRDEFKREPPQGLPGSLWIINIDGTGKRKLVEPGRNGVWSPDGKKIAYWVMGGITPEGKRDYDYLYIIDSDGQNPTELTWKSNYPLEWTQDGSMILMEGGFYNISTNKSVKLPKLAQLPIEPRLSPDGEKIVGEPKGFDADICVTYMYVTDRDKAIKLLKKTHFKRWED